MVLIDATTLAFLVTPNAKAPKDPATDKPVDKANERVNQLVASLETQRQTLIIPTPALAEVLVLAGDEGPAFLERIGRSSRLRIVEFDVRAAVELAAMTRDAIRAGDKRGGSESPWQKVKMDRQIVAIAKVHGATTLYSDDVELTKFAENAGLKVVKLWELPLPEAPTPDLFDH